MGRVELTSSSIGSWETSFCSSNGVGGRYNGPMYSKEGHGVGGRRISERSLK
jgi:hypothetical protein